MRVYQLEYGHQILDMCLVKRRETINITNYVLDRILKYVQSLKCSSNYTLKLYHGALPRCRAFAMNNIHVAGKSYSAHLDLPLLI